jgi:hypothetical protein
MEVLEDTLEEGNVDVKIRKTNTVTVNLTSKMSTDVFHPFFMLRSMVRFDLVMCTTNSERSKMNNG